SRRVALLVCGWRHRVCLRDGTIWLCLRASFVPSDCCREKRSDRVTPERVLSSMDRIRLFGAIAAGTLVLVLFTGCSGRRPAAPFDREIISTYSIWHGMGPPK